MSDTYPFRSAETRDRYYALYDSRAEAWPLASERRMVATDDGATCVWVTGAADAPPLVLLMGVWGHSLQWPPALIERLATRFRVFAFDNICDVGRSVGARPLKTAAEFCGWIDGVLDALAVGPVVLAGLSRGGWLTGEYLLHAPQRVSAAILISPALTVAGPSMRSLPSSPYSMGTLVRPTEFFVGGLMRHLMPYWAKSDPEAFRAYVAETALSLQCFDTKRACPLWGPRTFSDDELRGFDVPVLYVAGEEETMSSPAAAVARLGKVAPGIETAVIPNAAHDLISVRTDALAGRMLTFLPA